MKYYQKLSDSAAGYIGRQLTVRSLVGWGWRLLGKQDNLPPISNVYFTAVLENIKRDNEYRDVVTLRIDDPKFVLNGEVVTAIPWCDGSDFDFKVNICNAWGLFFGPGSVSFNSENMPVYNGDQGIQGWGVIALSSEVIRSCVPGIAEIDDS